MECNFLPTATLSADELEPPTHTGTFTILEHTDKYVEVSLITGI